MSTQPDACLPHPFFQPTPKGLSMQSSVNLKFIAASLLSTMAGAAFSHDGHGMTGSHWHATDVWGFVALAALVAVALWLSKRDK